MDIRRLVERVADALGPDATADRVEAVAEALMEQAAPVPPPAEGDRFVVLARGADRPGLLAALAAVAAEAGCSISDVSLRVAHGRFTLLMLLEATDARSDAERLRARYAAEAERFGLILTVQHAALLDAASLS